MITGLGDESNWIGTTTALNRISGTCMFNADAPGGGLNPIGQEPKNLSDAVYDACGDDGM